MPWEKYRYGRDGHYGPDYRLDNGEILGCPFEEENGVVWFGVDGERRGYFSKELMFEPAKSGDGSYVIAIKVHQADGTLNETFQPTGDFSQLDMVGELVTPDIAASAWIGGPDCDHSTIMVNGTSVGTSMLKKKLIRSLSTFTS